MIKIIVKLIGSLVLLLASIAAVVALLVSIWGYCVPQGFAVGAATQKEMQEYLVAQMPELKGADASQVSFEMDGIYHVYYDGKTYIVNDASIQNNIEAFMDKYDGFNFRSSITSRSIIVTIVGAALCSLFMTIGLMELRDCSCKIREEKRKKVAQAVKVAT